MRYSSLFICILLTSCASTTNYYSQTTQSWRGGSASTLVNTWGRPDQTVRAPNGSTLYIYKTENYRNSANPYSPSVGVHFSAGGAPIIETQPNINHTYDRGGVSLGCTTVFAADAKGKIYDIKNQGNNCYGSQSYMQKMKNPA